MQGQTDVLKEVGITFTDTQATMIKSATGVIIVKIGKSSIKVAC